MSRDTLDDQKVAEAARFDNRRDQWATLLEKNDS